MKCTCPCCGYSFKPKDVKKLKKSKKASDVTKPVTKETVPDTSVDVTVETETDIVPERVDTALETLE